MDFYYYTNKFINSHAVGYPDSSETSDPTCSLYEHLEANYIMCKVNYGGFISSDI
jgi:hypothetical protein